MKERLVAVVLVLSLLILGACQNAPPLQGAATWDFSPSGETLEVDLVLAGPADLYLVVANAHSAPVGWVAEDLPEFPEDPEARGAGLLTDDVAGIIAAQARYAGGLPPPGPRTAAGNLYRDVTEVGGPATLQGIGQPDKAAHLRVVVGPVATRVGERTLKIWVADDCWTGGGSKPYLLTPAMVNAVAEGFLREGADNDLYDAVTAIAGPEYGEDAERGNPALVPFDAEIHLFLYDLDDDATADQRHGWAGFFNAGDLYAREGSNRNVFLHVDAPWLARPTAGVWDVSAGWPARFMAVIVHELTHAIQFYRQGIQGNVVQPGWMVEMIPQMMEDAVVSRTADPFSFGEPRADGASSPGRRDTRIAFFNAYPRQSFEGRGSSWRSIRTWYAANELFGGWIMRRYGGPVVLQRILGSARGGFEGIVDALSSLGFAETPESLLLGWARAVLLSDVVVSELNRGGWFPFTLDGSGYTLFSQDYFDHEAWDSRLRAYSAGPQLTDLSDLTADYPLNPVANNYFLVGRNLEGTVRLRIGHRDLPRSRVLVVAVPVT